MSDRAHLIRLTDSLVVHPSEITKADRCGSYTHVWLRGNDMVRQIWDEEMTVWNAIMANATTSNTVL